MVEMELFLCQATFLSFQSIWQVQDHQSLQSRSLCYQKCRVSFLLWISHNKCCQNIDWRQGPRISLRRHEGLPCNAFLTSKWIKTLTSRRIPEMTKAIIVIVDLLITMQAVKKNNEQNPNYNITRHTNYYGSDRKDHDSLKQTCWIQRFWM